MNGNQQLDDADPGGHALETAPDGHRIRLVQRGFPAADSRDEFAGAWPDVLAELAERVSQSR